jgi:pimeloyl-ACP methyl ester carboxylesterase
VQSFSWAQRHPDRVKAIVYREAIVRRSCRGEELPVPTRAFFQAQRTPAGEDLNGAAGGRRPWDQPRASSWLPRIWNFAVLARLPLGLLIAT